MTIDSAMYKVIYNYKSHLERTIRWIQFKKLGTWKSTNQGSVVDLVGGMLKKSTSCKEMLRLLDVSWSPVSSLDVSYRNYALDP